MPEENVSIIIPTFSHAFFTLLLKNIITTGGRGQYLSSNPPKLNDSGKPPVPMIIPKRIKHDLWLL